MRANACAEGACQQLSTETQTQIGSLGRYPTLYPVQLGAHVSLALGIVDTLNTAVDHHRRELALVPRKGVSLGRVTPLQREAARAQMARHPVVAPIGHMSNEQYLPGHRNLNPVFVGGGECIIRARDCPLGTCRRN